LSAQSTTPAAATGGRGLRRVLATVTAACSARERWWLLAVYVLFAAITVLLARRPPRHAGAEGLLMVLLLPTFFLWAGWFARLLLLQLQARAARIPGLQRDVAAALAWMALATLLLPALALGLAGVDVAFAAVWLACIALAGLLFALLPRGIAALTGLTPMLSKALGLDALAAAFPVGTALPLLAVALALLVAWRWRAIVRGGEALQATSWRQPLLFAMAQRGSFWGGRDLADARVQVAIKPRWMLRVDGIGQAGPARPVQAMRIWLGTPFTALSGRQLLGQLALLLVVGVLCWRMFLHDGHDAAGAWAMAQYFGLFVGGAILVATFAMRLQGLYQRHGGELAELALLPGWGDAGRLRRTLLQAVARPLAAAFALVLLVVAGVGIAAGDDVPRMALLLLVTATMALLGAVLCLRALAGSAQRSFGNWLLLLAGIPLSGLTAVALSSAASPAWQQRMLLAWLLVALACGAGLVRAWRRFDARPHPFLQS
jgi:hypothetical protein